jgi:hypothetical protein
MNKPVGRNLNPREAYLVKRRSFPDSDVSHFTFYLSRDTLPAHSILRFTLHERRFTHKSSERVIIAEVFMNNASYALPE